MARGFNKYWRLIPILMAVAAITTSLLTGCGPRQIEITLPDDTGPEEINQIYIGGAVNNPGIYPLRDGDSISDLILAAGGISDNADLSQLELRIPETGEATEMQKVDINRAPAWLLEALPGIGEVRAQDIINYREQNGPFRTIYELLEVKGIGPATFENIEDLITVAD